MGALAEALGLAWPGSTTIAAGDPRHLEIAQLVGERIVDLARTGRTATSVVTPEAIANALVVLAAIGGSTNAVIHLTAMARRLGHDLSLADVDRVGRLTPVLVDVEPSGSALIEDLDAAGGFPSVFRVLDARLDGDAELADGRSMKQVQADAAIPGPVIHDLEHPVDAEGAFRVVRGNLAPDGALIKRSAATPELLSHRGPAYVIGDIDDLADRTGVGAICPEDAVLVFAGIGPVGGPGMPEWGMIPVPEPLLARGVTDMVRVTDARMSGTSFGTVYLHVAPEGAVGGVIGLVRDGDMIRVDAELGVIELEVEESELARRRETTPSTRSARGYVELYRRHVNQAPEGCDFDFLVLPRGETPTLVEPVVGRS
jgi:dihydroxy-acid dehydratase